MSPITNLGGPLMASRTHRRSLGNLLCRFQGSDTQSQGRQELYFKFWRSALAGNAQSLLSGTRVILVSSYLSSSWIPNCAASPVARAMVARCAFSKRRKACCTEVGGPRSRSSLGGGRRSNISSILVTRENMT